MVRPEQGLTRACPVSAVLLAAGSSRRFGSDNKLLAGIGGKPLIRHGAEALAAAGFAELIVVTGPDAAQVQEALTGLAVRFVHNAHYLDGMGGSVAAGIRAVAPASAGALVSPGDMPRLEPALIAGLVAAFASAGGDRIVYPCLPDGSQRNPVIWPRRLFGELAALTGETGAKSILQAHASETIRVEAAADSFLDIDTREDLARVKFGDSHHFPSDLVRSLTFRGENGGCPQFHPTRCVLTNRPPPRRPAPGGISARTGSCARPSGSPPAACAARGSSGTPRSRGPTA